jgi:hypothetical protein
VLGRTYSNNVDTNLFGELQDDQQFLAGNPEEDDLEQVQEVQPEHEADFDGI